MKIFFSGIGGSGVSAIAGFQAARGHEVAGSDRLFDLNPAHPFCADLKEQGITIVPQDGTGLDGSFDFAVFSTAVEKDNADYKKAHEIGVRVKTRPQYLSEIVKEFKTIAVAGTSGKSTTAGMLAYAMHVLGVSPNYIGGGRVKQFRRAGNCGNFLAGGSEMLIIEACESDGTIRDYLPEHSLVLNLDFDHHSVTETAEMFRLLEKNTRGMIISCADDENLSFYNLKGTAEFSVEKPSRYRAAETAFSPLRSAFVMNGVPFELAVPGKHNVYNALACISLLSEMGISMAKISSALREFGGIERRFDVHLNEGGYLVVDDYAHNPHKIESLMNAMRKTGKRVCYIFQPHGFAPTRLMKEGYIRAFSGGLRDEDLLILLPIFYAGGTAAKDISSFDLADGIREHGKKVLVIGSRDEISHIEKEWDSYAVLGARDDSLSDFANAISDAIKNEVRSSGPKMKKKGGSLPPF